jgi:hypothetical protein
VRDVIDDGDLRAIAIYPGRVCASARTVAGTCRAQGDDREERKGCEPATLAYLSLKSMTAVGSRVGIRAGVTDIAVTRVGVARRCIGYEWRGRCRGSDLNACDYRVLVTAGGAPTISPAVRFSRAEEGGVARRAFDTNPYPDGGVVARSGG